MFLTDLAERIMKKKLDSENDKRMVIYGSVATQDGEAQNAEASKK